MAKIEKKVVLTEEEHESLDRMLKGISLKYAGWGGWDYDDIYQECWQKALEIIVAYHGEMPNLNLIAQSCYNKIFDLGRYAKRRVNQIPIDTAQFDWNNTSDDTGYFAEMEGHVPMGSVQEAMSNLAIEELMNLFAEGSNEREYVFQVGLYVGAFDTDVKKIKAYFGDQRMDLEIALNLGFANDTSNGYRNVKRRVQAKILEFNDWERYRKPKK